MNTTAASILTRRGSADAATGPLHAAVDAEAPLVQHDGPAGRDAGRLADHVGSDGPWLVGMPCRGAVEQDGRARDVPALRHEVRDGVAHREERRCRGPGPLASADDLADDAGHPREPRRLGVVVGDVVDEAAAGPTGRRADDRQADERLRMEDVRLGRGVEDVICPRTRPPGVGDDLQRPAGKVTNTIEADRASGGSTVASGSRAIARQTSARTGLGKGRRAVLMRRSMSSRTSRTPGASCSCSGRSGPDHPRVAAPWPDARASVVAVRRKIANHARRRWRRRSSRAWADPTPPPRAGRAARRGAWSRSGTRSPRRRSMTGRSPAAPRP